MKFSITKNKNHAFEGTIECTDKDNALLEKYFSGMKLAPEETFTLDVFGEYTVEWDEDIPMPQVSYVTLSLADEGFDPNLDLIDLEQLEQLIESSADQGDWYADKMGSEIDDAMDRYQD